MSKAHADALWRRCLAALARLDLLPGGYRRRTPSEIARRLAANGDDRLARFVGAYYYPAFYGDAENVLARTEAERFVAELEGLVSASAGGSDSGYMLRADAAAPGVPVCSICGRRPAAAGASHENNSERIDDH